AREFAGGWRIHPDVVVQMPRPYVVHAQGAGEIKEFFLENPFKEDTWVSSIEIRPGDPSVVHHVIVQVPEQANGVRFVVKTNCQNCEKEVVLANAAGLQQPAADLPNKEVVQKAFLIDGPASPQRGQNPIGSGSYNDQFVRLR